MKTILTICFAFTTILLLAQQKNNYPTPDKVYGDLFTEVQMQAVFPDQKTFPDCTPKRKIAGIMYDYGLSKGQGMDLAKFVTDNFNLPPVPSRLNYIQQEKDVAMHIKNVWGSLRKEADLSPRWEGYEANGMSLLALPYSYIVPGGRFGEMHYWDSYFTIVGLQAAGQTEMIENMVKNFDYLISNFGHIPAGNRTYYLSRSQPPFFCMMVELLAGIKGNSIYKKYLPSMLKEYKWWMQGADTVTKGEAVNHVVKMPDGAILNRYWDENDTPRPENYRQDIATADTAALELAMVIRVASEEKLKEILSNRRKQTYRNLRAAAESGWDASSRWCTDANKLSTIQTTSIIPVDLNCLLYKMESVIAKALKLARQSKSSLQYTHKALMRKKAIVKYCWNPNSGFFTDYNFETNQPSAGITAAGIFPLFVKIATPAQAAATAKAVESVLLKEGGLVATGVTTALQWDAPNGWAPVQWIAVNGFRNYTINKLSNSIAKRWLSAVEKMYATNSKLLERYNVEDISTGASGGGYPVQEGFGWTNGVYLGLKKMMAGAAKL